MGTYYTSVTFGVVDSLGPAKFRMRTRLVTSRESMSNNNTTNESNGERRYYFGHEADDYLKAHQGENNLIIYPIKEGRIEDWPALTAILYRAFLLC